LISGLTLLFCNFPIMLANSLQENARYLTGFQASADSRLLHVD
jgi:hypothetical protein